MFAIFLGIPYNRRPLRFSFIIFLMFWFFLGFMLAQLLSSALLRTVRDQSYDTSHTIKELIKSGKTIGGLKDTKSLFIGNETFENYKEFERIEYEKKLQDLISGKNKTMALSALMNSSSIPTKFDSRILRILPEALTTFPLGFPVWRGLPYLNDIDKDLQILIESGIISHFGNIETKHVFSKDNNDGKISDEYIKLNDLVPGFLILGIGYAVGLIFFFFEIMISRVK
uniref:Ionotropic receptor n=1 Tax=Aphidius gifuensis TaxID=684658 RepID=A0A3S9LWD9_APHGI|nr:ionotropic receptor [Aphidius gifuensis]